MRRLSEPIQEVEKAHQMFLENSPLLAVIDTIWFGCGFHTSTPIYIPKSFSVAFGLYDRYKDSDTHAIAHCMLLLGRIFNAKGAYLPACRFFLCANELFKNDYGIIAMEFLREELRSQEGKRQIELSREEFNEKYKRDTHQILVEEYRSGDHYS
jgi:hypothetical protein